MSSSSAKFLRLLPFIIIVFLLLLLDSGDTAWIRRGRSGRIAMQQIESSESVNRTENHGSSIFAVEHSPLPFVNRRVEEDYHQQMADKQLYHHHHDDVREGEDPMLEEEANNNSKVAEEEQQQQQNARHRNNSNAHEVEDVVVANVAEPRDPMLEEAERSQIPFVRSRSQKMQSTEAMDVDSAVSFDHHRHDERREGDPMLEEVANSSKVAAENKTLPGASAVPSHHQPADNEQDNKKDPMLEEAENNAIEEAKDEELIAANKHQQKNVVHRRNNGHDGGGAGVAAVDPMLEEARRQVVANNGSKQQKSAILGEDNGAIEVIASANSDHGVSSDQHNPQESAVSEHLRGGETELPLHPSCSSDADDAILQLVPFATEKTRKNPEAAAVEHPAEHPQQHHQKQPVFPHPGVPLKKRKHQHNPQKKPVSEHRVGGENLNTAELRPSSSPSSFDDDAVPQKMLPLASGGIRQTPAEHPAAGQHMFPNKLGVPLKKRKYPQMSLTSISAQNAIGDNRASGANANANSDYGIIEHAPPEDMTVVVEGRGEKLNTEFRLSSSSSSHDDDTLPQLVPFADGTRQHPAETVAEHSAAEQSVLPHPALKKIKHRNAFREEENNVDAIEDNRAGGTNFHTNVVSSDQHNSQGKAMGEHLGGGGKFNTELRPSSSSFFSSSSSNDADTVPQLQLVPFAAEETMQQNPPEDAEHQQHEHQHQQAVLGQPGVPLKKRKHHRMLLSSVYARESDLQNRNTAKDDDVVVIEDAAAATSGGSTQQILEGIEKRRYKAARKRPELHNDTDEEHVEVETAAEAAIGIGTHANLASDDATIPETPLVGEQEGQNGPPQQEQGQEEEEEHQQQRRLSDSASVKKNDFHGRTRTTFTKSQLRTLRESFDKQNCLEDKEWKRLRQVLGLRLYVIGNWFLHAQYIKKKTEQPLAQHPAADEQQNGTTEIRKYTKFTESQKRTLRASFAKQYWLEDEEWIRLSDELGLELKVIGDWFLNARRQKAKEASSNALEQQCSNRTTKFTKSQLRTLRESFAKQNCLEDEEWLRLSQELGLRLGVIGNWFLHTRHIKKKAEQPLLAQHPAADEHQDDTTTKQKYTQFSESQKRTLRASFAKQDWQQDEEWIRLSRELGLRLGVVGNWFKNARRQKSKDASKVLEQQQQFPQQQAINSQKTRFTKLQLSTLRDAFAKKKRPDEEELEMLSRKMDLPYRVIKTWFERQRTAAKIARVKQQTPQQRQATDEQAGTAMPLEEANNSRSRVGGHHNNGRAIANQKKQQNPPTQRSHKRQQVTLQGGGELLTRFLVKKPRTQRMPLSREEQHVEEDDGGGSAGSSASEG